MKDVEQKMLGIIDFAKEAYDDFKDDDKKETRAQDMEDEIMIVKIDHMRKSGAYIRTLESWSLQLGLTTLVVTSRDKGIILLSQGDKCQMTKFLLNWKTTNIDVDSKGKPCKERMIQILYREQLRSKDISWKSICEEKFATISCNNLLECFKDTTLESLINTTFY